MSLGRLVNRAESLRQVGLPEGRVGEELRRCGVERERNWSVSKAAMLGRDREDEESGADGRADPDDWDSRLFAVLIANHKSIAPSVRERTAKGDRSGTIARHAGVQR